MNQNVAKFFLMTLVVCAMVQSGYAAGTNWRGAPNNPDTAGAPTGPAVQQDEQKGEAEDGKVSETAASPKDACQAMINAADADLKSILHRNPKFISVTEQFCKESKTLRQVLRCAIKNGAQTIVDQAEDVAMAHAIKIHGDAAVRKCGG